MTSARMLNGAYDKTLELYPALVTIQVLRHKGELMKKTLVLLAIITLLTLPLAGCAQADRVSANLSLEADNFNVVRKLTVINSIQGDVLFQMIAKMSIKAEVFDNQLEVVVEDEKGNYAKHFIGLSDNVSYIVEDMGSKSVNKYRYELNFNPKMWIPVKPVIID